VRASADPILLQFDDAPLAWSGPAGPFRVLADRALPGFVAVDPQPVPPLPAPGAGETRTIRGIVGGEARELALHEHADRLRLCSGSLDVAWTRDGRRLRVAAPDPALALEGGLGIGLVAALAARDVFCLHGAALGWREGALVLAGPSGSGKSTFARALAARGMTRLADDILPVDAGGDCWPAFPQLKLDPAAWSATPGPLPVRAVVLLERGSQVRRLDVESARTALLAATAGARAFPVAVLSRHLDACAAWARRLPVWRLGVAHAPDDPASAAVEALARLEAAT
jgi:hypothetical protein